MRLEGKVAIVSGGGTGIGAATARMFAREGAKVVVTGRRARAARGGRRRDRRSRRRRRHGGRPEHVRAAVATAVEAFGGLDIVVANAGLGFGGARRTSTTNAGSATLDVNLSGAFRLARAAIPALIERGGGSIVLVSSVNAFVSGSESAAYGTSKAAMNGLARSIAVDYGPKGIRANAICPGWVITEMGDRAMEDLATERGISRDEAYALVTRYTPLRRPATADEIAACCLFLASDESSIVTGTALVADGGGLAMDLTEVAYGRSARELRPFGTDRVHHRRRFGHRPRHRAPARVARAPRWPSSTSGSRRPRRRSRRSPTAAGPGWRSTPTSGTAPRSRARATARVNAFGHIDYLVNNAGLVRMSPLDELAEDEWDLVLDTNLKGMYLVTQAIAPVIAGAGGGAIVNLATIESEVVVASTGHPQVHYNASKGGVKMLTKALAVELAGRGIRVNAVAPGAIATSFIPGGDLRSPEAWELDEGPAPRPPRRRTRGRRRGDLVPALGRRLVHHRRACCRSTGGG